MFCSSCGHILEKNAKFCDSCGASTNPGNGPRNQQQPSGGMHSGNSYIGRYRSGVSVIFLTIVTCGIYGIYWMYVTMEDINHALGERRINSGAMLLGGILCFPIMWVALYQIDKNLALLSRENGTRYTENFVLWAVLTLLAGVGTIVAYYQVAEGLNAIWDSRGGSGERYR